MEIKLLARREGCRGWRFVGMVVLGIIAAVAFALLFGLVVQFLWNWLMPDLFGFKTITYLQAFALVILAKIFFGGFGHGGDHGEKKQKSERRWSCGEGDGQPDGLKGREKDFERYWARDGRAAFERYLEEEGGKEKE